MTSNSSGNTNERSRLPEELTYLENREIYEAVVLGGLARATKTLDIATANVKDMHVEWQVDTMPMLLSKGAKADAQDAKGNTPVHLAARKGPLAAVGLLLKKSASQHQEQTRAHTAQRGEERRRTAPHFDGASRGWNL
ncbi:MAG: ankyrin repeat domain-containing protein [Planctomycetes bacterium]|nr:ankyrin repeat domain-containing protein [Planctomycetota bacterium]